MILCLVTDRHRRPVIAQCRDAVYAGVDLIQVRERDLDAAALTELTAALVGVTRATPTKVIVNDRLDIAVACGAHGVHLRGDSIPAARARAMAPPDFLIGQSVRSVEDAVAAREADYLIAGTVFPTESKPGLDHHLGVDGLAGIVKAVPVPVLAIGGISMERIESIARSGAAGVAAIGLLDAPKERLAGLVFEARRRFDRVRSAS